MRAFTECDFLLACHHGPSITNQGDQITVPAGLYPHDTKAVLGVLVSHALN